MRLEGEIGTHARQSLLETSTVLASLTELAGAAQPDVRKHTAVHKSRKLLEPMKSPKSPFRQFLCCSA